MLQSIRLSYFLALIGLLPTVCYSQDSKSLREEIRAAVSNQTSTASDQFRELQAEARQGNSQAMLRVAACLRGGLGVERDLRLAHIASLRAAELGEKVGMYEVAVDFLEEQGVTKDTSLGIHWLTKASELDHVPAVERLVQEHLGRFKRLSRGGTEVLKWAKRGADLGSISCMMNLGECYSSGIGTEVDESKAFTLYAESANRGYTQAKILLAGCYAYGLGTEANSDKALKLLKKAAASDDPKAFHAYAIALDELVVGAEETQEGWDPIGLSPRRGNVDLRESYQIKVVELLEQAVRLGRLEASAALARKLAIGEGCTQDSERAFALATTASQEGVVEATAVLGDCYMEGLGVKPNAKKGASLYLRAAKAGSSEAQYKYAMCLATGNGVRANEAEFRQWMASSAAAGNVRAAEFIQQLRERDMAQVRSWLDSMVSSNWVNDALSARSDEAFAEQARLNDVMRERERISQ